MSAMRRFERVARGYAKKQRREEFCNDVLLEGNVVMTTIGCSAGGPPFTSSSSPPTAASCEEDEEQDEIVCKIAGVSKLFCIYCEQIATPIYQCEDGHITCKRCYDDGWQKVCTPCMTSSVKIRVPALEDLMHSISVACKYSAEGCIQWVNILEKEHHEGKCLFVSRCPFSECSMFEKPLRLSLFRKHTISCHSDQFEKFTFDHNIDITMNTTDRYKVLLDSDGEDHFLMNREKSSIGDMCYLTHLTASTQSGEAFSYRMDVTIETSGTLFRMVTRCQFPTAEVYERINHFIVVPSDEDVSIEVKIYQT